MFSLNLLGAVVQPRGHRWSGQERDGRASQTGKELMSLDPYTLHRRSLKTALFPQLGLPSTLIRLENALQTRGIWKLQRWVLVWRKENILKDGAFRKRWRDSEDIRVIFLSEYSSSITTNTIFPISPEWKRPKFAKLYFTHGWQKPSLSRVCQSGTPHRLHATVINDDGIHDDGSGWALRRLVQFSIKSVTHAVFPVEVLPLPWWTQACW